jgi:site-specific recombinase XerD
MVIAASAFIYRYLNHLKTDSKAPKTIDNRRNVLIPFFRKVNKLPEEVTLEDIERYLFERALEVKPSTLQIEKQAIRGFFRYCYEHCEMDIKFRWDVVKRKKVKPPKIETFTPQQISQVVANCKEEQDKLIISLMFESGVRIGEVLSLQVSDIEGTQIHVRGKGENDRMVFITHDLAKAIHAYVANRGYHSGHVFRPLQKHKNHPNDRYISAYGVRDRIEAAFWRCGYKMHPHQLRHSFAKNWLMQGGDLRTLQILLGHADLTTTQRYLGLTDKETEAIYHRVQLKSVLAC